MRTKKIGIYKITNLITGCVYVGSSFDLYKRMKYYGYIKSDISSKVKESILIYGFEKHEMKILCELDNITTKKELFNYEDAFILLYLDILGEYKIFNSYCNDKQKWIRKEYRENLIKVNTGRIYSEITREKLSDNAFWKNKNGSLNKSSIKINQYELDGTFIKTWDSMHCVDRYYNKSFSKHIVSVCKGVRKTAYGFIWKYAD